MKITKLETIFVQPRWLFLKMHTDEGLVGLGEPIVEGRARTVATAPGLGIELDDAAVAAQVNDGDWHTPRLFHADDGSFGEW